MQGRARLYGHSVHPALATYPLALLSLVWVFDLVGLAGSRGGPWGEIAFWVNTAGLVGGFAAGLVGFLDFLDIPPGTRAHRVALTHLVVQLCALLVFGLSWGLRLAQGTAQPHLGAFVLSLFGAMGLVVGGWLGGELVQQHGMSVRPEAHLDAPSSLEAERFIHREAPSRDWGSPSEPEPT